MTIVGYIEKIKRRGHGGSYTTHSDVNQIVGVLLQNDFLNTICYIAPEIIATAGLLPKLETFEDRYLNKAYVIDYALLDQDLQKSLKKINTAILNINQLLETCHCNQQISANQIKQIFTQCLVIAEICYSNYPKEIRQQRLSRMLRDFQEAYTWSEENLLAHFLTTNNFHSTTSTIK